jgi:hypothetical protein
MTQAIRAGRRRTLPTFTIITRSRREIDAAANVWGRRLITSECYRIGFNGPRKECEFVGKISLA